MFVSREAIRGCVSLPHRFDAAEPLQAGLGRSPWLVAIASMLLCRARRAQAEPVFRELLRIWPTAPHLARADEHHVQDVVRPCGFHRNRARQLVRFSNQFLGDGWNDVRELVGVGDYVSDAIGLFCFGMTNLDSADVVLHRYAESLREKETSTSAS